MSDWHELSAADVALLKSCGPGEFCWLWGDELVKTNEEHMKAALDVAVKEAYRAALTAAAGFVGSEHTWEVDDISPGAMFLRVTVRNDLGQQASGIGMIPRPYMEVH